LKQVFENLFAFCLQFPFPKQLQTNIIDVPQIDFLENQLATAPTT